MAAHELMLLQELFPQPSVYLLPEWTLLTAPSNGTTKVREAPGKTISRKSGT